MFSQVRTRLGVRVHDVYFADAPLQGVPADVENYIQCAVPLERAVAFNTLHVGLDKDIAAVWDGVGSNCRYKIKRARDRDATECRIHTDPTPQMIEDFCDFYDEVARQGGWGVSNRRRLALFAQAGALTLAEGLATGEKLCAHAHICDGRRARLLYSASAFRPREASEARNTVGRVNRLLHWNEIEHFHARGFRIYDFGGVSTGELEGIDRFKREFGGTEVTEYNRCAALTSYGSLAVLGKHTRERLHYALRWLPVALIEECPECLLEWLPGVVGAA